MSDENQTFSKDDYIPPAYWAKDHWSTLAYIETVMVDCGGFQVGYDPRMRSNRRNWRVMNDGCPRPNRPMGTSRDPGLTMNVTDGTRLRNGVTVVGHDDWNCMEDMANIGLFDRWPDDIEPGTVLQLSPKGAVWCNALREHKRNGRNFAEFTEAGLPEMPEGQPKDREYYQWMGERYDVTRMLEDIDAGKLRPATETLDAQFIETYATRVLACDKTKRDAGETRTMFGGVDVQKALKLPDEVLKRPAIVAYVGKNKGLLNLGSGTNFVLADGNHRVARAFMDDIGPLKVYMLSAAQTRKYRY